jgi:hypothetical protein
MSNDAREKARRMASRGATPAEIRQATGLSGDAARTVASNWAPAAQAAAPPTVQEVRQATGANKETAAQILARVTGPTTTQTSTTTSTTTLPTALDTTTTSSLDGFDASAIPPNLINTPMFDAATQKAGFQTQYNIADLQEAGETERTKLLNENRLATGAQEIAGKLDLQKIVNAGYKNIANIERGSNMFASIMSAFNF